MEEAEEKCDGEPGPAAGLSGPESILQRHKNNAGGDYRLDDTRRQTEKIESRECESDGMRGGKSRHDFHQFPQATHSQDERGDE